MESTVNQCLGKTQDRDNYHTRICYDIYIYIFKYILYIHPDLPVRVVYLESVNRYIYERMPWNLGNQ